MSAKLLDHLDAADRFPLGVVQEVKTHEATEEVPNQIVAHG